MPPRQLTQALADQKIASLRAPAPAVERGTDQPQVVSPK